MDSTERLHAVTRLMDAYSDDKDKIKFLIDLVADLMVRVDNLEMESRVVKVQKKQQGLTE